MTVDKEIFINSEFNECSILKTKHDKLSNLSYLKKNAAY